MGEANWLCYPEACLEQLGMLESTTSMNNKFTIEAAEESLVQVANFLFLLKQVAHDLQKLHKFVGSKKLECFKGKNTALSLERVVHWN